MTFGHGTDAAEAGEMVSMALDAGVTFFDTANAYSNGESERMLGRALAGQRDRVVLATKFTNRMGPGPNDAGWSRAHVMNAVEGSLTRLGTDYIDIYYIHHTEDHTPIEETLTALDDLVRAGKVRYVACSNFEAWRLNDAIWTSQVAGLEQFICYQANYSLVMRDIEAEVLPAALRKGLGIVAFGALAGGFLTGKYEPGERSKAGTRSAEGWVFPSDYFHPNADTILKTVIDISRERRLDAAHVALAWVLEQRGVASALVGARTQDQLRTNLKSTEILLDEDDVRKLDEVSRPKPRYPQWMEAGQEARRESGLETSNRDRN
jgi:aryl-alcohol dehydrogenase-like predicted oxidoreductase